MWFDKFCNKWGDDWRTVEKFEWINKLAGKEIGNSHQIKESTRRLMRLAKTLDGRAWIYTTEFRFVTGMGRSHPVENGFAWHQTLGTPFLAGSSVKGMVKAWAEAERVPKREWERSLGSPKAVGGIRFLDAVPTHPVRLEIDVMTPHFAGWDLQNPPGDWRSPKPIPFLTTAAETRFLFCVVPTSAVQDDDLDVVSNWLQEALAWAGAGAKTAVGYGRMKRGEDEREAEREISEQEERARKEKEQAARWAAMNPVQREIAQVLENRQDKGMPESTAIFQKIQAGHWQGDDKRAAAEWLRDQLMKEKRWRESSAKKRPDKDVNYKRTRRVMAWLE